MKEDMPNWRRFVEGITGRPYGTISPEPPKKKTGDRREGGVESNQRKQKQDNV